MKGLLAEGVAVAVPLVGLVAVADVSARVGGVVSVPVLEAGTSPYTVSTHTADTLYVVPGDRPVTGQRLGQVVLKHVPLLHSCTM